MKKQKFLSGVVLLVGLISCQEEIDLNLNEASPQIVIEANLNDRDKEQKLYISKTTSFNGDNQNQALETPAEVYIIENGNQDVRHWFTLNDQTDTKEYISNFTGKPGVSYQLVVKAEGKTYIATSVMPQKVELDSISLTTISFLNESRKYVKLHYQDPAIDTNAYRTVLKINEEVVEQYFVDNDRFNNGKYINVTLYNEEPEIVRGDKIDVDFQTIDNNIYRYFYTLSQISGGGGPPVAPSNPPSNFDNGALGYFSAHTSQKRSFDVNN